MTDSVRHIPFLFPRRLEPIFQLFKLVEPVLRALTNLSVLLSLSIILSLI